MQWLLLTLLRLLLLQQLRRRQHGRWRPGDAGGA
jgi:hypothetical protein